MTTPTSTQTTLPFSDFEQVYEQLAVTLDEVPEVQETLFLAQLALALSHRIPELEQVMTAIQEAREGLET
jgi:urate oxidase